MRMLHHFLVRSISIIMTATTMRGACSVMVIIIENGDGKPGSNPEQGCLHFTRCLYS